MIEYKKVLSQNVPDHIIEAIHDLTEKLIPAVCKAIEGADHNITMNSLIYITAGLIFYVDKDNKEACVQAAKVYADQLINEVQMHCDNFEGEQ